MPLRVKFDQLPAGYALTAARPGERASIVVSEFTSSEDGALFVGRLEGLPNDVLNALPADKRVVPSQVDNLLAIIDRDGTATVYLNEIPFIGSVRVKRPIKAGEAISSSDIADVARLQLGGITILPTNGIVLLFSCGWRKGLFFDLAPISGPGEHTRPRSYDLELKLGQCYAYLLFQHLFSITEDTWKRLLSKGWFPFIRLSVPLVKKLVAYARDGLEVDDLVPDVEQELRADHEGRLERWRTHPILSRHFVPLSTALSRYLECDYCSTISILFTKIEGVLRTHHLLGSPTRTPSQARLAAAAVSSVDASERPYCLLLPQRFRQFLKEVYFADFDPTAPAGVSRHTVGHGVVPADAYSPKHAAIAILILDQLAHFLTAEQREADGAR